jgi:hypothetical protein
LPASRSSFWECRNSSEISVLLGLVATLAWAIYSWKNRERTPVKALEKPDCECTKETSRRARYVLYCSAWFVMGL